MDHQGPTTPYTPYRGIGPHYRSLEPHWGHTKGLTGTTPKDFQASLDIFGVASGSGNTFRDYKIPFD